MPISTTYADPTGMLALTTGQAVTEAVWDQLLSNLKHLGGVAGTNAVRVSKSADQSLTNATWTALTWNTETAPSFDTNNLHSTVSDTTRLTAVETGLYLLVGTATFAAGTTGARMAKFVVNGVTDLQFLAGWGSTVTPVGITAIALTLLAATDYVELQAIQISGGALAVSAGGSACGMVRLGLLP